MFPGAGNFNGFRVRPSILDKKILFILFSLVLDAKISIVTVAKLVDIKVDGNCICTDDPAVAFKGADYAIFLGAFPRKEVRSLTHKHPIRLMTHIIRLMSPSHAP